MKGTSNHLVTVLICVGMLALLVAVLILPNQQTISRLDQEIVETGNEIERQRIMYPLYTELQKQLAFDPLEDLPSPEGELLTQQQIEEYLSDLIEQNLVEAQLMPLNITPQPESVTGSELLQVNCTARGSFFDMRGFLINLGDNPFFRRVEKIDMEEVFGEIQFDFTLWLAAEGA